MRHRGIKGIVVIASLALGFAASAGGPAVVADPPPAPIHECPVGYSPPLGFPLHGRLSTDEGMCGAFAWQ